MPRILLAPDASSLLVADVFGVSRVAFGKQTKVKHTTKVTSGRGLLSVNAAGSLALVDGRIQTGAYGNRGLTTVGLPALGVRDKLGPKETPFALVTTPAGDRVLELTTTGHLRVYTLANESLQEDRTLDLAALAPQQLPSRTLGLQSPSPRHPSLLHTNSDGDFVARFGTTVYAGHVGADADSDAVWWALPLLTQSAAEVTFAQTAATTWVFVRDASTDRVHPLALSRDGTLLPLEGARGTSGWPSLTAPAVDGATVLTQPDSDTVVAWFLADGSAHTWSVAAYNPHPAPEPDPAAFPRGLPPAPTRLPGTVAVLGSRRVFVPWHGETVVLLDRNVALSRGLDAGAGPFRRLMRERFLELNEALRHLGIEAALTAFERHPKYPSVSLNAHLPPLPATFAASVALGLTNSLWRRFELATHGLRWGGFGLEGGHLLFRERTEVLALREVLAWMCAHGLVPPDLAAEFTQRYHEGMGIPSVPLPDTLPFTPEAARLFLRTLLETLSTGRWPPHTDFDAWSAAPLTAAEAEAAVQGLVLPQGANDDAAHLVAKALAQHLGLDALPALRTMIAAGTAIPGNDSQARAAGEAMTWVVHHHPEGRDESLAALDALLGTPEALNANAPVTLALTRERVARGARHFWSNG